MSLAALLLDPFVEFAFMRRALVGVLTLSVGAAPIGVFLMLRRMSLTGDAMSHAILPGVAFGFLLSGLSLVAMTVGGVIAGILVALLASGVARTTLLKEDASLAAFYLISLAGGVLIVSLRGSSVDLLHLLFGNVLALDDPALYLIAGTATVTLATMAVIYRPLVVECVDPGFLRVVSGSGPAVHMIFMFLVVVNLVAGYQALGTLLAIGMMMLPALSARFWSRDVGAMIVLAAVIAAVSGYVGLLLSYGLSLPTGPAVVLVTGVVYVASLIAGPHGGLARGLMPTGHRTA